MRKVIWLFLLIFSFIYGHTIKLESGTHVFNKVNFLDKSFNIYLSLFCALASNTVYDADFNKNDSKNFLLYKKNGFDIATIIKKQGIIDIEATIGYKKISDNHLFLISFRGTNFTGDDAFEDMLTDLDIKTNYNFSLWDKTIGVHEGFFKSEQLFEKNLDTIIIKTNSEKINLMNYIKKANRNLENSKNIHFIITGHSLGGAIATLFAARLIDYFNINPENIVVYTYGAPGVGNEHFKYLFEDNDDKYKVFKYFYRVRNLNDPVPYLTSKKLYLGIVIAGGVAAITTKNPKLARIVEKLAHKKYFYYHIGKQYLILPSGKIIFGKKVFDYKINVNDINKIIDIIGMNVNPPFLFHKLNTYISFIHDYIIEDKKYMNYCFNKNNKNLVFYRDMIYKDLTDKKSGYNTSIININENIKLYKINILDKYYCVQRILNRYYFDDEILPMGDNFIPDFTFNMVFSNYFNKYKNIFNFLRDKEFMKTFNKISTSVIGPLKKEDIITFINYLIEKYNIKAPSIFKNQNESEKDFYYNKIFISKTVFDEKIFENYLNRYEAELFLSYLKAANSKRKWILQKDLRDKLIKIGIDPYYYYLYHQKRKFKVDTYPLLGISTLKFLEKIYLIIKDEKASK